MEILTIELINDKAYKLLQNMEELDLIRVLKNRPHRGIDRHSISSLHHQIA